MSMVFLLLVPSLLCSVYSYISTNVHTAVMQRRYALRDTPEHVTAFSSAEEMMQLGYWWTLTYFLYKL